MERSVFKKTVLDPWKIGGAAVDEPHGVPVGKSDQKAVGEGGEPLSDGASSGGKQADSMRESSGKSGHAAGRMKSSIVVSSEVQHTQVLQNDLQTDENENDAACQLRF